MAPITSAITRVLVTGFGPFGGVPDNPSWGIASRLPSALPSNIELLVHPSYVPVSYHPTLDLVPTFHDQSPDIALHIGVAAGRKYFAVEQTSQKSGYEWVPGVDGEIFTKEEQQAAWGPLPEKYSTSLDLHATVARWKELTSGLSFSERGSGARAKPVDVRFSDELPDMLANFTTQGQSVTTQDDEVKWSDAVGTYLCGFIYYASMAEMGKRNTGEQRNVAFLHVPSLDTEEQIKVGVDVTVALIQALVEVKGST
ncbi:peptidase C15, pyroglutamyl peptidase I-like protein [Aaosphaeria arxii CBS 175.79]|uniref:Peptidase C15, pyroglutamyl peptidase I-like protein n=1 Tax=Aaosphaeria arxii CBS 175.79 TaxID=1450172 RepID=A0A6A5XYJ8_9PLEO|nr:peptidase C15, pyroglutamyl peptidase I-like protein [Aaosphaeria arxii CBS 175.79]KAF2018003.1 peptidase C15, pyroglutamyl peptidase I-like protein [Aaosphaeria arxii CBS 175.79]